MKKQLAILGLVGLMGVNTFAAPVQNFNYEVSVPSKDFKTALDNRGYVEETLTDKSVLTITYTAINSSNNVINYGHEITAFQDGIELAHNFGYTTDYKTGIYHNAYGLMMPGTKINLTYDFLFKKNAGDIIIYNSETNEILATFSSKTN